VASALTLLPRWRISVTKKHIVRRKQTIQTWLVTKVSVYGCGGFGHCHMRDSHNVLSPCYQRICEHVHCESLGRRHESRNDRVDEQPCDDPITSRNNPEDMTEGSKDKLCCLICLEPFLVDEFASWSSTDDCDHAFHPSCIEEWLLHNKECPCCRRMYLLVDYTRRKIPREMLKSLQKKLKRRCQSTSFCIEDGIVTKKDSRADTERRCDKIQYDYVARNLSELDREDDESLAGSDEDMQSQEAGCNLPLWRKVLESLPASASHNLDCESRDCRTDGNEESRVIRTKESSEAVSTTLSTNVSPM
jgi:hypothetical protein